MRNKFPPEAEGNDSKDVNVLEENDPSLTSTSLKRSITECLVKCENQLVLSSGLLSALAECFMKLKKGNGSHDSVCSSVSDELPVLSKDEIDDWLIKINRTLGRGTEFRRTRSILEFREKYGLFCESNSDDSDSQGDPAEGKTMTFNDFAAVYRCELGEGKFWAVEHDIKVLRGHGMADAIGNDDGSSSTSISSKKLVFTGRFDRIYFAQGNSVGTGGSLRPINLDVLGLFDRKKEEDVVSEDSGSGLVSLRRYLEKKKQVDFLLPNEWHPSDHLPVLAEFQYC